mgnify:CR=1 FL=1
MGRLLRVFTPFIILLVVLLVLNYKIEEINFFQKPPLTNTPEHIEQQAKSVTGTQIPADGEPKPIATAIANATEQPTKSPEATQTPIPTLLPSNLVTLTGPPAESRFSLSAPLTFYWYADKQLSEGESFELFLANDAGEKLVSRIFKPNMGTAYQVNFIPDSLDISPGEYFWGVKFMQREEDHMLGESDRRSITLIGAAK